MGGPRLGHRLWVSLPVDGVVLGLIWAGLPHGSAGVILGLGLGSSLGLLFGRGGPGLGPGLPHGSAGWWGVGTVLDLIWVWAPTWVREVVLGLGLGSCMGQQVGQ